MKSRYGGIFECIIRNQKHQIYIQKSLENISKRNKGERSYTGFQIWLGAGPLCEEILRLSDGASKQQDYETIGARKSYIFAFLSLAEST